jgi:hypothetical protein
MADRERSSSSPSDRAGRIGALIVTNGTKAIGVYIVLKEAARESTRDSVLIVGALLAMGAQTVESIVLAAIDRFFGGEEKSR